MKQLLSITLTIALMAGAAFAQGLPSKEQIRETLKKEFDKLPSETVEHDGIKVTYKKVPSNLEAMARKIASQFGRKLPPAAIKMAMKQYGPMIDKEISKNMATIGTLETPHTLKIRGKKVVPGKYKMSLYIKNMRIYGIILVKKTLKKKVRHVISLNKFKRLKKMTEHFHIKFYPRKKKPKYFRVAVGFRYEVRYGSRWNQIYKRNPEESSKK